MITKKWCPESFRFETPIKKPNNSLCATCVQSNFQIKFALFEASSARLNLFSDIFWYFFWEMINETEYNEDYFCRGRVDRMPASAFWLNVSVWTVCVCSPGRRRNRVLPAGNSILRWLIGPINGHHSNRANRLAEKRLLGAGESLRIGACTAELAPRTIVHSSPRQRATDRQRSFGFNYLRESRVLSFAVNAKNAFLPGCV